MPPSVNEKTLTLTTDITPSTPKSGEVSLFADSNGIIKQIDDVGLVTKVSSSILVTEIDGTSHSDAAVLRFPRGTRFDLGSSDTALVVTPRYSQRKIATGIPYRQGSGYAFLGGPLVTATSLGGQVNEFKNKHATRRLTTNTSTADTANLATDVFFRAQHNPLFSVWIHTGSVITNQRIWAGMFSAAPGNVATLGTTQAFGFAYFSSDGNLSSVTCNGTTTTRTTIVTMAADTSYLLTAWLFGSNAFFQIDNGTITSTATTLPASTTNLLWTVALINTSTVANTINIGRGYLETD